MPIKTAIYDPPKEGLPYLIVTFTSDGLKVLTANSSVEARAVVSERMIRRRRELKKEEFLADVFAVYLKTKNFHWHASVPHFREYHPLFDEQGEQIFAVTDDIAERVRKIGARLAFDRQYWPLATAQGQ
jgi:hypothetical protein